MSALVVIVLCVLILVLAVVYYRDGYRDGREDAEDEKIGMLRCYRCGPYKKAMNEQDRQRR
jgi:hypothetical protein